MVAPIRVTSPSSTAGSSASCWALLKRWISSRKKTVCPPPRGAAVGGALDHRAHLGTACLHGAELLEGRVRMLGDHSRERRLARPGRAVEDHRVRVSLLDRRAQRRVAAEQVCLADELLQPRGSHARRQWAIVHGGSSPELTVTACVGLEQRVHLSQYRAPCTRVRIPHPPPRRRLASAPREVDGARSAAARI